MKIIGITGGIATGKSTLCNWFRQNSKFPILDADLITHEIISGDVKVKRKLEENFGKSIFQDPSCTIVDRGALGKIVFHEAEKKKILEAIIHPIVFRRLLFLIAWNFLKGTDAVIVEVPLLFELGLGMFFSEIIVTTWYPPAYLLYLLARRKSSSKGYYSAGQICKENRPFK